MDIRNWGLLLSSVACASLIGYFVKFYAANSPDPSPKNTKEEAPEMGDSKSHKFQIDVSGSQLLSHVSSTTSIAW